MVARIKWLIRLVLRSIGFELVALEELPQGFGAPSPSTRSEYKNLFAGYTLQTLIDHFDFISILDIGSGQGLHADVLERQGKLVTTVDYGRSIYFERGNGNRTSVIGDYQIVEFDKTFDAIWASHVLEHQPDPSSFLKRIFADLKDDGVLAITVPPLKHELVGGHVSLWNAGILLYQLILAGFDCSNAHVRSYGYNISVILKKKHAILPELDFDSGDIDRLADFFPKEIREHSLGIIEKLNWEFE